MGTPSSRTSPSTLKMTRTLENTDFNSFTTAELRDECEDANVQKKGSKAEVVERLEHHFFGKSWEKRIDLWSEKASDLKDACRNKGLDASGVKADLVARLLAKSKK